MENIYVSSHILHTKCGYTVNGYMMHQLLSKIQRIMYCTSRRHVTYTNLEDMSECGLSVWYRASVGLVGQAVDDIAEGGQVGVEEEGVMAWQSQVALHQSL